MNLNCNSVSQHFPGLYDVFDEDIKCYFICHTLRTILLKCQSKFVYRVSVEFHKCCIDLWKYLHPVRKGNFHAKARIPIFAAISLCYRGLLLHMSSKRRKSEHRPFASLPNSQQYPNLFNKPHENCSCFLSFIFGSMESNSHIL